MPPSRPPFSAESPGKRGGGQEEGKEEREERKGQVCPLAGLRRQ